MFWILSDRAPKYWGKRPEKPNHNFEVVPISDNYKADIFEADQQRRVLRR